MATSDRGRILSLIGAVAFVLGTMALGYLRIGLPPVVIVGGSGVIALVMWNRYYLKRPPTPDVILPLFLLTVAALEIHMMEEYLTGFGPAMSRLFDISWTERSFLIVFAFVGPALYALTALGLYFRVPLAGFMAGSSSSARASRSSLTSSFRYSSRRSARSCPERFRRSCRTAGSLRGCATTTLALPAPTTSPACTPPCCR